MCPLHAFEGCVGGSMCLHALPGMGQGLLPMCLLHALGGMCWWWGGLASLACTMRHGGGGGGSLVWLLHALRGIGARLCGSCMHEEALGQGVVHVPPARNTMLLLIHTQ